MKDGIRDVEISISKDGRDNKVSIVFGPHYFIKIYEEKGKTFFELCATHHGFKADASDVGSELEGFIGEIRDNHPQNMID
mgnify:CR=1 FL=1